ncbi:AmmeMemoRadiSam system protein B [bacterium]|nr:AmmeMemoRadiSam system protein B [candidate division CSSED10-310 bacterium]
MTNKLFQGAILLMILVVPFWKASAGSDNIRQSILAGSWYPGDAETLSQDIQNYFDKVDLPPIQGKLHGFIAPHAGYIYSAPVAAYSYALVRNASYDLVVIIGNSHRVGFSGAAIDDVSKYITPLGEVPVDNETASKLASDTHQVRIDGKPHRPEHSIEIQVPFLQKALKPGFKILPILFGYDPGKSYSFLITQLPKATADKKVLFIASTDLTHFPKYEDACRIDKKTVEAIASLDVSKLDKLENEEMSKGYHGLDCVLCGSTAVKAVMEITKKLGADKGVVLKVANSGDVSIGDKHRVVGYGSVAFLESEKDADQSESSKTSNDHLTQTQKSYLLGLSRYILDYYVTTGDKPDVHLPRDTVYLQDRGVFVTLKIDDQLRGCIGYIQPQTSLFDAVVTNTINSCSRDPRFRPVKKEELDSIDIEISVLTPPRKIDSYKEIEIGRHGVVLKKGFHQAVFLPQVAPEQGWDREETLQYLSLKAGLERDGWKQGAEFEVFEAEVFGEKEMGRQTFMEK